MITTVGVIVMAGSGGSEEGVMELERFWQRS